jgi:hypothetical protein
MNDDRSDWHCKGDPIECNYEAALGQLEAQHQFLREAAQQACDEWIAWPGPKDGETAKALWGVLRSLWHLQWVVNNAPPPPPKRVPFPAQEPSAPAAFSKVEINPAWTTPLDRERGTYTVRDKEPGKWFGGNGWTPIDEVIETIEGTPDGAA